MAGTPSIKGGGRTGVMEPSLSKCGGLASKVGLLRQWSKNPRNKNPTAGGLPMTGLLWLVFVVLLVPWIVGFAVSWGTFIWLLLMLAIIALLINVIGGLTRGRS